MYRLFTATLPLIAAISLLACSPEENSRFGDAYWDPDDTWDKLDIMAQPPLNVVYRNAGTEEAPVWQAYLDIDFSHFLALDKPDKAASAFEFTYQSGLSEKLPIPSAWLQNGQQFTDSHFFYDDREELPLNQRDKRIRITEPGEYAFNLSFKTTLPSGKERTYDYGYYNIRVPGQVKSYRYFRENVEPTLREHCFVCHNNGPVAATTAFSMNNNSNTLRTTFLTKVKTPTAGKSIRTYPFSSAHRGTGDASNLSSDEMRFFTAYVDALLEKQASGSDIATDIDLITIAKPSTMMTDPHPRE